jgi:hypothetical protein
VTGPSFPDGEVFVVPANGSIKIDNLLPGEYTVVETTTGWTATYSVEGGKVTVIGGENAKITVTNKPSKGVIYVEKLLEGQDGYALADGFEFAVYAEIDSDGNPVGKPIAFATTENGVAVFGPSTALVPGKTYYVFEMMTEEQDLIYDAQLPYIEVVAVNVATYEGEVNEFYNDLGLGALEVDGYAVVEYVEEHERPLLKMNSSKGTCVSHVGFGSAAVDFPDGIEGFFFDNGFTYLKIEMAVLEGLGDDGLDIGIAWSNKDGGVINERWNAPVGKTYNIKVVDNQLVLTSDPVNGEYLVVLSSTEWTKPPMEGIGHGNISVYSLEGKVDKNGFVYFFFHMEYVYYTLVVPIEIIGWEYDYTSGPFIEPFGGEFLMVVSNEGRVIFTGDLGLIEGLEPGDYLVSILADGNVVASETLTVEAGKTTFKDFGQIPIPETRIVRDLPST